MVSNKVLEWIGVTTAILYSLLVAFNVGLEIGQMVIMMAFLIVSTVFVDFFRVDRRDWKMIISSVILGVSLKLILETNYLF